MGYKISVGLNMIRKSFQLLLLHNQGNLDHKMYRRESFFHARHWSSCKLTALERRPRSNPLQSRLKHFAML